MSAHSYAIALAVPVERLDDAHSMATALGWQEPGAASFGTPLSATGSEPATHYALVTVARPDFVATLADPGDVISTTDWATHGLTAERVMAVMGAMVALIRPRSGGVEGEPLLSSLLAAQGLQRIIPDGPV